MKRTSALVVIGGDDLQQLRGARTGPSGGPAAGEARGATMLRAWRETGRPRPVRDADIWRQVRHAPSNRVDGENPDNGWRTLDGRAADGR